MLRLSRWLSCKGVAVPVEPQVFELLAYLIKNRDRVASKDELIRQVVADVYAAGAATN